MGRLSALYGLRTRVFDVADYATVVDVLVDQLTNGATGILAHREVAGALSSVLRRGASCRCWGLCAAV